MTIGGGYSHIDARLSSEVVAAAATVTSAAITAASGSPLAGVTRNKFNIFADARIPISNNVSAFARADVEYVGPTPAGLPLFIGNTLVAPAFTLPGYATASIRAGDEFSGWTVTAYVNNLANKRAFLSADNPDVNGVLLNRPRSIGMNAKLAF